MLEACVSVVARGVRARAQLIDVRLAPGRITPCRVKELRCITARKATYSFTRRDCASRLVLGDRGAGASGLDRRLERRDVVGAVVADAVDEERRRAGHLAEVGAVDIARDPSGADMMLDVVGEAVDVEAEVARVADQVS